MAPIHAQETVLAQHADFAAEYATTIESGICAETLAMLIMLPFFCLTIPEPNSWQEEAHQPEINSKFRFQLSSTIFSNGIFGCNGGFWVISTCAVHKMVVDQVHPQFPCAPLQGFPYP
jgi:hypothetical protein